MIVINRWYQPDCTLGRLALGEYRCFTLEPPDLGNQPGVSCIPPSEYSAFKRLSPKNGLCVELRGVPGRSFIQIHAGNHTRQTEGCILPGQSITYLDGDTVPDVAASRAALNELLGLLPSDGFSVVLR